MRHEQRSISNMNSVSCPSALELREFPGARGYIGPAVPSRILIPSIIKTEMVVRHAGVLDLVGSSLVSERDVELEDLDWVESSVINDIDADFKNTFCLAEKDSDLQINRFCEPIVENGCLPDLCGLRKSVSTLAQLEHFAVRPI